MPNTAPLPTKSTQDTPHDAPPATGSNRHLPGPITAALLATDRKLRTSTAPIAPDQYIKLLLGALAKAVDDELRRVSARQGAE